MLRELLYKLRVLNLGRHRRHQEGSPAVIREAAPPYTTGVPATTTPWKSSLNPWPGAPLLPCRRQKP